MKKILFFTLVLLLTSENLIFAQGKAEIALEKGKLALEKRETGQLAEAATLLEEAVKLDQENIHYPYELAYVQYLSKNYKKAIKILEDIKKRKNSYDKIYQLLGNAYESNGQRDKSIDTYLKGLSMFPNSGHLFLEMGVVHMREDETKEALAFFEKGIKNAPLFASNYYWVSKIYCNSTEPSWGKIYGEIFLNLENNSVRTEEISKLLYDTYFRELKNKNKEEMPAQVAKEEIYQIGETPSTFIKEVYKPLFLISASEETSVDLSALVRIKVNFLHLYYSREYNKNYPNILFEYNAKVDKDGHSESYNYWLLMQGNLKEFSQWKEKHKKEYVDFLKWFNNNPLQMDKDIKFHKEHY